MRILAVNCGSSTLKFELFDITGESRRRQARGIVDGVGKKEGAVIEFDRSESPQRRYVGNHREASLVMLARLGAAGLLQGLDGVGHRIVHGGDRFRRTALVTPDVLGAIDSLTELAPLHNQPSLDALHVLMEALGGVPNVAVFDTAFHRTMPDESRLYAIPLDLADRHHVQRYGFHGLAHRYMVERCAALMSMPRERLRIISLQLGNGCSAAAVMNGVSVDTSMGLTPLEGLVMGTRSGDVDPGLAGFLARKEARDAGAIEGWLNTRSGLLGVSGRSSDMRELLAAEGEDRRAALAIRMFCYRARKYLGAYLAVLGGADAVTFGGGIGENAPAVRERILDGMDWCGLRLDKERNAAAVGREGPVSAAGSNIAVYVIPVEESAIIAKEAFECLSQAKGDMNEPS